MLPESVGFSKALHLGGKLGRMNVIDWKFDLNNRYTVWSGILGGFFLQLSYFGTDQSQVGRYLTGSSIGQSRLGLIMNGLIKVPMQFLILLIGVLVFAFYQFNQPPLFFNRYEVQQIKQSHYGAQYNSLENQYAGAFQQKKIAAANYADALDSKDQVKINETGSTLKKAEQAQSAIRKSAVDLIKKNDNKTDASNDTNYVFLNFVTHFLPKGLIGLLIAIVFLASMGSTASALNSLASTSVVDIYKRIVSPDASDEQCLKASRWSTVIWGLVCIAGAFFAGKMGQNLLEAVNELGSYIYGTILGVFVVAFFLKKIRGTPVFIAAIITEAIVVYMGLQKVVAYLWLNAIGCILVIIIALLLNAIIEKDKAHEVKAS